LSLRVATNLPYRYTDWTIKFLIGAWAPCLISSVVACTQPLFPSAAVKDLDPALQMGIFNSEADVYFKGHLAQAGGRIIANERTSDGILITAEELPLTKGSTSVVETAKSEGWFVFLYRGQIDRPALEYANKLIMVGVVEGNQRITIKGVPRTVPYLVARCLHVWKTGRYAVSDYPNLPDGYFPLEQQTYCLPSIR
jgi:starvation-inducible outer membrane lipoprotein